MKLYLSVKQLPELAHLSEQERLAVCMRYRMYHTQVLRFHFAEVGFVAFIILAEIAGLVGGWFYWRGFWGSLAGAVLAMWFVMAVYYFVDLYTTIPKLRRFLQSEHGRRAVEEAKELSSLTMRSSQPRPADAARGG